MRFSFVIALGIALCIQASMVRAQNATASSSTAASSQTCVDVRIGNDRSAYINCLNQHLQEEVEQQHAAPTPTAPITADSSSTQVGTFNQNAAQEKMGNAFGRSAIPQRPQQTFVNPLLPH